MVAVNSLQETGEVRFPQAGVEAEAPKRAHKKIPGFGEPGLHIIAGASLANAVCPCRRGVLGRVLD